MTRSDFVAKLKFLATVSLEDEERRGTMWEDYFHDLEALQKILAKLAQEYKDKPPGNVFYERCHVLKAINEVIDNPHRHVPRIGAP